MQHSIIIKTLSTIGSALVLHVHMRESQLVGFIPVHDMCWEGVSGRWEKGEGRREGKLTMMFRASCLALDIKQFICYETKIEEGEKAGSCQESNPEHLCLDPSVLCH